MNTASLVPLGFRYADLARAKISYEGKEYVKEAFQETKWVLTSDIVVDGRECGSVKVYYIENKSNSDDSPFLTEERDLIDGIAESLSEVIERKRAEQGKAALQAQLEQSEKLPGLTDINKKEHLIFYNYSEYAIKHAFKSKYAQERKIRFSTYEEMKETIGLPNAVEFNPEMTDNEFDSRLNQFIDKQVITREILRYMADVKNG